MIVYTSKNRLKSKQNIYMLEYIKSFRGQRNINTQEEMLERSKTAKKKAKYFKILKHLFIINF